MILLGIILKEAARWCSLFFIFNPGTVAIACWQRIPDI